MKKVILGFVLMGLLIGGAFSAAQAQEKKQALSLNLGAQTNSDRASAFNYALFTLDARVGLALGRVFEISPEVMVAVDDSLDFDFTYLYPGLLLNLKLGYWFVGAGAVLPVIFYEGESHSVNLSPKFNFGFSAGPLVVTAYLIAWTEEHTDFMEYSFIGATIGYRF